MTEDEMAEWHHQLNGHESEQTPGVGGGQGGLACCDSWGRKESDSGYSLYFSCVNFRVFVNIQFSSFQLLSHVQLFVTP